MARPGLNECPYLLSVSLLVARTPVSSAPASTTKVFQNPGSRSLLAGEWSRTRKHFPYAKHVR
eukprot:3560350-Prorocentrum_lima.AAC.1